MLPFINISLSFFTLNKQLGLERWYTGSYFTAKYMPKSGVGIFILKPVKDTVGLTLPQYLN